MEIAVCIPIGHGAGEPSWTCLTHSCVGSHYIFIAYERQNQQCFGVLSNKYNINTVVLGHSKHIEGFVAESVCARAYAYTESVYVCTV